MNDIIGSVAIMKIGRKRVILMSQDITSRKEKGTCSVRRIRKPDEEA